MFCDYYGKLHNFTVHFNVWVNIQKYQDLKQRSQNAAKRKRIWQYFDVVRYDKNPMTNFSASNDTHGVRNSDSFPAFISIFYEIHFSNSKRWRRFLTPPPVMLLCGERYVGSAAGTSSCNTSMQISSIFRVLAELIKFPMCTTMLSWCSTNS